MLLQSSLSHFITRKQNLRILSSLKDLGRHCVLGEVSQPNSVSDGGSDTG